LAQGSPEHTATQSGNSAPSVTFREIEAPLISRTDVASKHVSVEWLRRQGGGPVRWRYRQNRHAVFCFERGVRSCVGALDGSLVRGSLAGAAKLAFVAAGSLVEAVFDVPADCSYLVASFDEAAFESDDEEFSLLGVPDSQLGFSNPSLAISVGQLRQELARTDALSRLLVESWAAQAWASLHRRRALHSQEARRFGPATLEKVLRYMRERIADDIALAELARLAGLSSRQFARRFRATTGSTPAWTLDTMRLDLASSLLVTTSRTITDIALE